MSEGPAHSGYAIPKQVDLGCVIKIAEQGSHRDSSVVSASVSSPIYLPAVTSLSDGLKP